MSESSPRPHRFTDADLAALYDLQSPWELDAHAENAFVSAMVWDAESVLDVGCGTGSMLHAARAAGHTGRLAGIDPDAAMLDRARRRDDVEWQQAKAEDMTWSQDFELATMTSNAFQCLIGDDEVLASLLAIRAALTDGGRFVFGTRHIQGRAWESWNPDHAFDTTLPDGLVLRTWHRVEETAGDVVTFVEVTGLPDGTVLRTDRGRLRFYDVPTLTALLTEAGLGVDDMYGDWHRGPVTATSEEIVTIARRT